LTPHPHGLECRACGSVYPVLNGRPILIDEKRSIFTNHEIASAGEKRQFPETSGWKFQLRRFFPANPEPRDRGPAMQRIRKVLPAGAQALVIGAGYTRSFYESIFPGNLVLTDVTLKGDADIACDGHCLPFLDESFDLIVADQVLEHVVAPVEVARELARCLKPGGIVYSGIPFYFPMHGVPYDFQRFTPAGHRMLFPAFELVELSAFGGPVGCFSLTLIGCAGALSRNLWWMRAVSMAVRIGMKPFAWFDHWQEKRGRASTVLLSTAFVGRKDGRRRSHAEMFAEVRGRNPGS
jgi:SAM-dependent methyltransferase